MKEIRVTVVVASSDHMPGEDPGAVHPMPASTCPALTPGPGSPGHFRCLTGPAVAETCPTGSPCRAFPPATASAVSAEARPVPVGAVLEAADTATDPEPDRTDRHPADAVSLARLRRELHARDLLQRPRSGPFPRAA
jgi:hypothetical protein